MVLKINPSTMSAGSGSDPPLGTDPPPGQRGRGRQGQNHNIWWRIATVVGLAIASAFCGPGAGTPPSERPTQLPEDTDAPPAATAAGGEDQAPGADATEQPIPTEAVSGDATAPAGPLPMGRLLFNSDRGGSTDVWLLEAGGDEPLQVTTDPSVDRVPSWGPDGQSVIFASDRRGGQNRRGTLVAYGLYVNYLDGSEDQELLLATDSFNHQAKYSPDGSRIAWYSDISGVRLQVWVMSADGSQMTQLTDDPVHANFNDWSPDGTQMLITSLRDSEGCTTEGQATNCTDLNREIYIMDADGTDLIRLTDHPATDGWPVFSPDGSRIAFYSDRDGTLSIYVMNADGGNVTRLTDDGGDDEFPSWSPDGSMIAFSTDRDGNQEIYVMNADGSGMINVTNHPARDTFPAWGE